MSKTYTLQATSYKGGSRSNGWNSANWDNYSLFANTGERCLVGADTTPVYFASYILFDQSTLSSLRSKTVTSVTLKLKVKPGTQQIPANGSHTFPISEKAYSTAGTTSQNSAWYRSTTTALGYIENQTSGGGSLAETELTISLGTTVPQYGLTMGSSGTSQRQYVEFSSGYTPTLIVVTNETDYSYTLAYNANGGSGAPSSQTGSNTGTSPSYTFTISNTVPTRTGYNFLGWSKSSTATSASYSSGGSITVTSSGTTTLYAVWKLKTYTISYNKGSNGSGTNTTATKTYGVALTLKGAIFTRTGYTQTGWSTSDGGSKAYNLSASYTSNSSATLYPYWTINTYTVSYDANGGNASTVPSNQTKTYGITLTLSSTKPTRANASAGSYTVTYNANSGSVSPSSATAARTTSYTFSKWNTASGGGGTNYSSGASYTENAAATLYAQWTSSTSTASVTLPTPTRTGYNFNGWYTASSGGTKVGNAGASYTPTGNVTLYAQWTASVVAPTFTTQPSSTSVYRGETVTLTVVATTTQGTITYKWQSSSNNSTFTNISGATSSSYSAPTSTIGTVYYRCVATATKDGVSKSTNSNSCSVAVLETNAPKITSQPQSRNVFIGATGVSVSVTATGNSLTYQWQKSSDNSTFTNISGATSTSYSYPTSSTGTYYYRCVVTNTLNGYTAKSTSSSAKIVVSNVDTPTFTINPTSASYAIGASATALRASASSNGTVSYQWQKSDNNSSWSNISGATSSTYTPSTSSAGVKYYRCVATAVGGTQTKTANSSSATITIIQASTPIFTYNLGNIDVTYNAGDAAEPLNGTATATSGKITYQWYKSTDGGATWLPISGATSAKYAPSTSVGGEARYRVVATNIVGTSSASSTSNSAKVTVANVILSYDEKWSQYINSVGKPFVKLARLDFLNPNGSVLYTLDNNPLSSKSGAFIQTGELSVNLQNGARRTATVTISNLDGEFDYSVNKLWFGQQVRLWEGMILPSGHDFYISQGVFYVKDPDEVFEPGLKQTTLNLVDKWAYLDGTLFGNLDGTYEVPLNSNIFNAIQSILNFDRGNGQKIDSSAPVFTNYYNGKTTTLPDGSTVPLTNTPYTYRCDSENGTYADVVLELNTMLAGWIGYDANGQLRLDPSQDDILDTTKPVQWQFSPENSTFLGATYSVKNSEVYNDIIVIGESLSEYGQTSGRATNYDPRSDTNANIIGLKTKRYQQSGYYTQDICESLAVFKLKRESVLKKSVTIKCSQLFHLQENNLVTIERTDKVGNPIERHLITGYTRPIAQSGEMSLNCTSVMDFPTATITTAP